MLEEYSSQATIKWETTRLRKFKEGESDDREEGNKESPFGQRQNAAPQSNNVK